MRLWEGMPRSGPPHPNPHSHPEPHWELSSPPGDVTLARALRPESSCESAAPRGCPRHAERERQALRLPGAFSWPLPGHLWACGPGVEVGGRWSEPPGTQALIAEQPRRQRARAPSWGGARPSQRPTCDCTAGPPRRHPTAPSTPDSAQGPPAGFWSQDSLSPALIAIRWRKWKITALAWGRTEQGNGRGCGAWCVRRSAGG